MQRLLVSAAYSMVVWMAACFTLAAEIMPTEQQNALVGKYCAVCHTDAAHNGGLTLEHFDAAHVDPSLAAMMVSKLRGGAMGASGIPRPDNATVNALVQALISESAGARRWSVNPTRSAVLHQAMSMASIVRELPATRPSGEPALYRLVLACNPETRQGNVQLSWAPTAKTGSLTASADGNPPVTFAVEGTEAMGNGMPGAMEPASVSLGDGRFSLPARNLTIANLFPGETVVFPFDELPEQARRELSICFKAQ